MTIRQSSNEFHQGHLAALAVGTFVLGTDGFVLPGLIPRIASDLSVSVAQAGQLTTVFGIAYALGSPVIAAMTGHFDRRAVIRSGMIVFLAGMVLQSTGTSLAIELIGRVIAALGAAAFQANAFAVAGALSAPERRARSFAVIGAGSSLAMVLGVLLGLAIEKWFGWRGALWTITALATVAAGLAGSLPSLVLPTPSLGDRLALLANAPVLRLLIVSALVMAPLFMIVAYVAPLVGTGAADDNSVLLALLVFGTGFIMGNRLVGVLSDRFGSLRTLLAALFLAVCILTVLTIASSHFSLILAALFGLGLIGPGLFIPQQNRTFTTAGEAATIALALNGSMNYAGTALGAALGGLVLSTAGRLWLAPAAAIAAAVILAITWTLAPERRCGRVLDATE